MPALRVFLPAELQLLTRFARPVSADFAAATAAELVDAQFDWHRLIELARFHGVLMQLAESLRLSGLPIGSDARAILQRECIAAAATDLRKFARWQRLCALFAAHGVRALTLKGFQVAFTIYGGLGKRLVGDFDFLVHPDDVARCTELLHAEGYRLTSSWQDALRNVGLARALDGTIEMSFAAQDGMVVDLHWSVSTVHGPHASSQLLESAEAFLDDVPGALGSSRGDTLAMLVIHGHKSAWARLRWLVDVARGLEQLSAEDAVVMRRHLERVAALPALANALALFRQYWGALPDVASALGALPAADERFVRVVSARHQRGWDANWKIDGKRPQRLLAERLTLSGITTESLMAALRPSHLDWAVLSLPSALHAGYYLVRPVRVLLEAMRGGRPETRLAVEAHTRPLT